MESIKCKFIPNERIWDIAEKFRSEYVKSDKIPIDVLDIIENDFLIQTVPELNLYSRCGIDAFLTPDGKEFWVDQTRYMKDNWLNRNRFTIAHELGHLYMHLKVTKSLKFDSVIEWIEFRINNSKEVGRFEYQGHEFAGRLLVPRPRLYEEVAKNHDDIISYLAMTGPENTDVVIDHLAGTICPVFGVSEQVIKKRIRKEKIFEELGFI